MDEREARALEPVAGPASYRNWIAMAKGARPGGRAEFPLYSDARIIGAIEEGLGPYSLVHAFPANAQDAALLLRTTWYLSQHSLPSMDKTDVSSFTGIQFADEVAALLSLCLGVRLAAGGATRFELEPEKWHVSGDTDRPVFLFPPTGRRTVLPRAREQQKLEGSPLNSLPLLEERQAIALIRAARCYRDALWLADSEPEIAWLLMVSALEVAAVHAHVENSSLVDLLRDAKPEVAARLQEAGADLLAMVAGALGRELKATGRFIDFMMRFLPAPPTERPPPSFQMDWSAHKMKKVFSLVYQYRSQALHEGIPFPPPMCEPPHLLDAGGTRSEVFPALAASQAFGVWTKKDVPISMHLFEYIARGALLAWWAGLAQGHGQRSDRNAAP